MKNKNAGMSLIELVVVVAIVAIMAGVGMYGLGQISGYRARECSKKISSSLTSNKVTTLGKAKQNGDIIWQLYQDSSNSAFYVKVTYNATGGSAYSETTKVSKGRVAVKYVNNGTDVTVDSTHPLSLCFNRSTGALCEASSPNVTCNITQINVSNGTKSYNIDIVPATGKVKQK